MPGDVMRKLIGPSGIALFLISIVVYEIKISGVTGGISTLIWVVVFFYAVGRIDPILADAEVLLSRKVALVVALIAFTVGWLVLLSAVQ